MHLGEQAGSLEVVEVDVLVRLRADGEQTRPGAPRLPRAGVILEDGFDVDRHRWSYRKKEASA
jgi:hypothetical protein